MLIKPAIRVLAALLVVLITKQLTYFSSVIADDLTNDLYSILGISKTATQNEIKSAYRSKARSTHPGEVILF